QVIRTLASNNVHQAAALVIDNHTGEVLAYVGSTDYFNEAQFGRNDGVQALRQPGSALKPFLYELALENRTIHPNTILADVPTHYAIPGAKLYSPTDYNETFLGPVRVRVALANSLNVPAVRVLEKVGVPTFLNRLQQLGFEHLTQPPEYYGLGLALGSGEVSLWELARAYVTLARQGQATPLVTTANLPLSSPISVNDSLLKRNHRGTEFAEERTRGNQEVKGVLDSARGGNGNAAWALITDMLGDAHARATAFGVDSVLSLPFSAAVKTGTSSDFRDTWTVGFTSDYTVATWVGNFTGDRMRQVSGVTGAAPLWNRIMLHLHSSVEPAAFPQPNGLVQRPICALSGLRPTPACPSIVQEYFYPEDLADYERQSDTFYQIASAGGDNLSNSPSYRLNLPPEYDEWVSMQRSPTIVSGKLKILFPRNGDVFLLNAASSPSSSNKNSVANSAKDAGAKLEFKVAGILDEPVEWWLNGQKLATNSSPSLFWTLSPGNWTLEVKKGELSDSVNFQVQASNLRSTRRGFSIANPAKRL
ncbi:MAG TPA: penicillin-binding transpeptidase domain-containing protein, partial [Allocoleopsis sp.]